MCFTVGSDFVNIPSRYRFIEFMATIARQSIYTYRFRILGYGLNILLRPFKKTLPSAWIVIHNYDHNLSICVNPVEHIGSTIFYTGFYEAKEIWALKRLIKPKEVILDIGANIGAWTLILAKLVPEGRVYAFEPSCFYKQLNWNIQLNREIKNIVAQNIALGAYPAQATISNPNTEHRSSIINYGNLNLKLDPDQSLMGDRIRVITLDDWVRQEKISRLDWIKLDVEGMELMVLLGGLDSLIKFHPNLLVEINENTLGNYGSTALQLSSFLMQTGYRFFYRVGKKGVLKKYDSMSTSMGESFNLICSFRALD